MTDSAVSNRIRAAGFTPSEVAEARLDLRVIEPRWRGRDIPLIEIEAVLVARDRDRRRLAIPFYAARPRQLVLL